MKIKRIHIENFAGLKNKIVDFSSGFNLIYGENEAGKSTIESFIKIWLYGMDNGRGKLNDRKKYTPLSGEKIAGELVIEHEEKSYIIRRTFGMSKKDDTCEILDEITGEAIKFNNKNEPGKDFLGINSSTFSKTLFISQLGVKVDKDKEEEIMEKITNIYNSGDESTSVKKAVLKLEKRMKQLVGARKNGELDLAKEKRNSLNQEQWQACKLGEASIENEESLLKTKELRNEIKEQIQKLDLYKKYLKKTKLQKDYKDIKKYLVKGEELKRKQEEISGELKKGQEYITIDLLNEINNKCEKYLSLLDVKGEQINKLSQLEYDFNLKNSELDKYSVFKEMGNNIHQKLYELKIEQKNIEDKLMEIVNIQNSITRSKREVAEKGAGIGNLEFFAQNRSNIEELLESYKDGLKELKYRIENSETIKGYGSHNNLKEKMIYLYLGTFATCVVFVIGILKRISFVPLSCVPIFIVLVKLYLTYSMETKNEKEMANNNEIVENLKNKMEEEEKRLELFISQTNSNDYEDFILKIKKYDKFKSYKDGMELIIKDREEQINSNDIDELKAKYNNNKSVLSSLYNLLSCRSIDEIIEKADEYEKLKEIILRNEFEVNRVKDEIKRLTEQLNDQKQEIDSKSLILGLESTDIDNLQIKLREYKEKINSINEVKSELRNVEETYKVLLKDRNIDEIKEEMKDIINQDITYSYESEDEIDKEIRKKSDELLKAEKEIKDLEHLIEKRYLGTREITEIEEEILVNNEKIIKMEKEYKALNLANSVLQESFDEMRKNIGPELNNKVVDKFNFLTHDSYEEAKISEDYKLKIRGNGSLFDADILSNGAKDQLYLSLRLSFIDMLFKDKDIPLFLDDAFIQYDDERRKRALDLLCKEDFKQVLFFTCQRIDKEIIDENSALHNYIQI